MKPFAIHGTALMVTTFAAGIYHGSSFVAAAALLALLLTAAAGAAEQVADARLIPSDWFGAFVLTANAIAIMSWAAAIIAAVGAIAQFI